MIDYLRGREIRLGVVSNCLAEDVAAWPGSSLASRFGCTVFSFEVGLAKPIRRFTGRPRGVWMSTCRTPGSSATVRKRNSQVRSRRVCVRSEPCGFLDDGLTSEKSPVLLRTWTPLRKSSAVWKRAMGSRPDVAL